MNENQAEKDHNLNIVRQTSFLSNIEPNLSTNHTFTIIKKNKKRMPWSEEEDKSIKSLVNKYGTTNWTLISNEMGQNRSGKQCRERWYNQLNPNVKKNNWTNEEENILFTKHMQLGNKWSDIASYLPGRTLNDIKNHFYSKLRKFIRKILKQINDENLFEINGIDGCKYTGENIYKMIKKHEITLKNLTKDTIFEMIIATEKNPKGKFIIYNDNSYNNEFNSYNCNINNIGNIFDTDEKEENCNNKEDICKNCQLNKEMKEKLFSDKMIKQTNTINTIIEEEKLDNSIKNKKNMDLKNGIKNQHKINKKSKSKSSERKKLQLKNKELANNKTIKKGIKNNLFQNDENNCNNKNINNKFIGLKRKKNNSHLKSLIDMNKNSKNIQLYHNNSSNDCKDLLLSENSSNISKVKTKNKKRKLKGINQEEAQKENIKDQNESNIFQNNQKILNLNDIKFLTKNENKENNNCFFYPPFKITTPKTSKGVVFPSSETKSNKSMKPDDFSISKMNFTNDYLDGSQMPQMYPVNYDNILLCQQKNKNIFISDVSFENNFLKSRGSCIGSSKNDNTYKNFSVCGGGNLYNKLINQNIMNNIINNNITVKSLDDNNILDEKNEMNLNKKIEKPTINLDLINHQDFSNNFNGNIIIGNESQYNSISNKNNPSNMYNYSPSSVCIPRVFGNDL